MAFDEHVDLKGKQAFEGGARLDGLVMPRSNGLGSRRDIALLDDGMRGGAILSEFGPRQEVWSKNAPGWHRGLNTTSPIR